MEEKPVELRVENPEDLKDAIDKEASWLRDGERVEVIYGEFWQVETPREDQKTRKAYKTKDFKIGCKNIDGKHVFRFVNKYMFSDIIGMFQSRKVEGKMPKSIWYEKPYSRSSR